MDLILLVYHKFVHFLSQLEIRRKNLPFFYFKALILSEIEQIANIIGVMHRGSLVEEVEYGRTS